MYGDNHRQGGWSSCIGVFAFGALLRPAAFDVQVQALGAEHAVALAEEAADEARGAGRGGGLVLRAVRGAGPRGDSLALALALALAVQVTVAIGLRS